MTFPSSTAALEAHIREMYHLPEPIKVTFLRRSFNEHYLVTSQNKNYVLRIYLDKKRNKLLNLMFELDLLLYLAQQNMPVAYPIKNKHSESLSEIYYQNEKKYTCLFSFAEGNPIDGILHRELANALGKLIAKLHLSSDDFKSDYSRANLDVTYLIVEPIEEIARIAESMGINHTSLLTEYVKELIEHFTLFPKDHGMLGVIHGDLNPSNIHYCENKGFTLFDFDHCAFGLRIHDLSVMKLCYPKDIFESILDGYMLIRPLQTIEINSIKAYSDILLIRKFKDILDAKSFENNADEKKIFIKNAVENILRL